MLQIGLIDAMMLLEWVDTQFDVSLADNIDPTLGNAALAIALNELMEPIRLPIVVMTTPTVVNGFRKVFKL
jgi:hypothetical protein